MAEGFFDVHTRLTAQRRGAGKKPSGAPASADGAAGVVPLTVSQLTAMIDRSIKSGVPANVLVKGEASNFKHHHASGHRYFTLKEGQAACIDCVMYQSDGVRLKFTPQDGMEMIASGRVAVWAPKGKYQLYASSLQPVGQGSLELAFRQLHAKLKAEGLFEPERKRLIPAFPMRIALVTSRSTAALQDIFKVLRRFAWLKLYVYHVPVQGDGSAEQIAGAIEHLGRCQTQLGGIDVLILARGGGSLEDLWEFNEEVVARAIAASAVPVVTGIGHEIDTSIADLVADHHAHTPTEAAQVITARWKGAADAIDVLGVRLRRNLRQMASEARRRLASIERHELFRRPTDRINSLRQLLDDRQRGLALAGVNKLAALRRRVDMLAERLERQSPAVVLRRLRERLGAADQRLNRGMNERLRASGAELTRLSTLLLECHPRQHVRIYDQRVTLLGRGLERAMTSRRRQWSQQVQSLEKQLQALGPQQVLERGYSITTLKKDGAVVRSASQVNGGERLVTRVADGSIESVAQDRKQMRLFGEG